MDFMKSLFLACRMAYGIITEEIIRAVLAGISCSMSSPVRIGGSATIFICVANVVWNGKALFSG